MSKLKTKFAAGDIVVVTGLPCESDGDCFAPGHVGVVKDDDHLVDFGNQGNSFVHADGRWWVSDKYLKHYTLVEDLPLWKSNHMYLNDEQKDALAALLHRVQWDEAFAEEIEFDSKADRVVNAFVWEYTEEDHLYWEVVSDQCAKKEVQQADDPIVSVATEKVIDSVCFKPIPCGDITVEGVSSNKYSREIKPEVFVDVYDVLRAFNVTDPCLQHLIKKALACGLRGHKDRNEDLNDIFVSAKRAIEMNNEWEGN